MMYAAADLFSPVPSKGSQGLEKTHRNLLGRFTGHLAEEDLEYFRDWDRLIDFEAETISHSPSTSWLVESKQREKENGDSISSLVFVGAEPSQSDDSLYVLICFKRSLGSEVKAPLSNLGFTDGSQLTISTDSTLVPSESRSQGYRVRSRRNFRHQVHAARGALEQARDDELVIRASRSDLERIRSLAEDYKKCFATGESVMNPELLFRIDKDHISMGMTTMRQNLINFLTADYSRNGVDMKSPTDIMKERRLAWLRDVVIRLKPPEFDSVSDSSLFFNRDIADKVPGCDISQLCREYARLNPDQRAAIKKVKEDRTSIIM